MGMMGVSLGVAAALGHVNPSAELATQMAAVMAVGGVAGLYKGQSVDLQEGFFHMSQKCSLKRSHNFNRESLSRNDTFCKFDCNYLIAACRIKLFLLGYE